MRLPITVNIEEKAQVFAQKKESLFAEFPQFALLSEPIKNEYLRTCIKNSEKINSIFLELGININLPCTKHSTTESVTSMNALLDYLAAWMLNSNYKEVIVIVFKDGSALIIHDDSFTAGYSVIPPLGHNDNFTKYYYNGKEIDFAGHTHKNSPRPSEDDLEDPNHDMHGLQQAVYYQGAFKKFKSK